MTPTRGERRPRRRKAELDEPERGGVHSLDGIVRDLLRARGLDAGDKPHVAVFRAWREAVGSELAAHARPARFQKGELLVECDSAAHLQELTSFTGENYRQRANEHLPQPAIDRVVFKLKR